MHTYIHTCIHTYCVRRTGPGTTWVNEINFFMIHAPSAGSIPRSVDQQILCTNTLDHRWKGKCHYRYVTDAADHNASHICLYWPIVPMTLHYINITLYMFTRGHLYRFYSSNSHTICRWIGGAPRGWKFGKRQRSKVKGHVDNFIVWRITCTCCHHNQIDSLHYTLYYAQCS